MTSSGPSPGVRTVGSLARLALLLVVFGGFVTWWLYIFTVYQDSKQQELKFGDIDTKYQVTYKWGAAYDVARLPGEVNFWVIVGWSVILGGVILTTIAERLPRESRATPLRRLAVRVRTRNLYRDCAPEPRGEGGGGGGVLCPGSGGRTPEGSGAATRGVPARASGRRACAGVVGYVPYRPTRPEWVRVLLVRWAQAPLMIARRLWLFLYAGAAVRERAVDRVRHRGRRAGVGKGRGAHSSPTAPEVSPKPHSEAGRGGRALRHRRNPIGMAVLGLRACASISWRAVDCALCNQRRRRDRSCGAGAERAEWSTKAHVCATRGRRGGKTKGWGGPRRGEEGG